MKKNLLIVLIASLFGVAGMSGCRQSSTYEAHSAIVAPDKKLEGARRFERQGWVYAHLEGPPDKIGYQHGNLLAKEIEDLLRVMKPFLQHQSKRDWNFYRDAAEKMLWPKMDKEYQDEIDGIVAGATAKGVKLDRYDVVAMNAFIELAQYYLPWMEKRQGLQASTKAPGNCSAFIATGSWTKDGRIVIGHNAWTDYVIGSRWNIIFDIQPEKGHRMLMDGLPGVIASMDDFGVNSNGIVITETTITGFTGFDPNGKPEFERARKAMQYSDSINDYVRIMLEGNNGGYANDWLVGDNKTGEIALFELGLKEHSVRRTKDGYFVGSNFPVDEKLMKAETNFDPMNKASSPNARRARWERLMAEYKGKIDVEAARKFETDGFDAFAKKQGANEHTLCGAVESSPRGVPEWGWPGYFPGGTVQAKVMDAQMAEKMQMWGSYGHACAPDFIAEDFLKQRKEYEWARGLLRDMKTGDWTLFEITR